MSSVMLRTVPSLVNVLSPSTFSLPLTFKVNMPSLTNVESSNVMISE